MEQELIEELKKTKEEYEKLIDSLKKKHAELDRKLEAVDALMDVQKRMWRIKEHGISE